jgi:hypothetical protein
MVLHITLWEGLQELEELGPYIGRSIEDERKQGW